MSKYLLWHKSGGWFTKMASIDSRSELGVVVDRDEALDMVKLHSGKLIPVERDIYLEAMKGVKQ